MSAEPADLNWKAGHILLDQPSPLILRGELVTLQASK